MKKLFVICLLSLLAVSEGFARNPHYVSIERSPVLQQLMDDIDISVEAAGAFRFNEKDYIVRAHPHTEMMTKDEVLDLFYSKIDFEYLGYKKEQILDVKKRFSKMIGEGKRNGLFIVTISSDVVPYYDVEYTAVRGKDYYFTLEFASEN